MTTLQAIRNERLTTPAAAKAEEPAIPNVEALCGDGGFLVLSRHVGEDIVIEVAGHTIIVRVSDVTWNRDTRTNRVKVAVKADRDDVTILRREVWELSQSERRDTKHG